MAHKELCRFKLDHYYTPNLRFISQGWVSLWHLCTSKVHLTVITHNETFKHAGVSGWLTHVIVSILDLCHCRHLDSILHICLTVFTQLTEFLMLSLHLSFTKNLLMRIWEVTGYSVCKDVLSDFIIVTNNTHKFSKFLLAHCWCF